MRGFTVACACLVILPIVLAYPWNEGYLPFKRDENGNARGNEFEDELILPKRGESEGLEESKDEQDLDGDKRFMFNPFGHAWPPKRDQTPGNDINEEPNKSMTEDPEGDLNNLDLEQSVRDQGEGYGSEGFNDENDDLGVLNMQRRNGWCGNWGDFCRPDAKMKYAQCCPGMRCMCGHFWTQGKCQCKSKGTFGR